MSREKSVKYIGCVFILSVFLLPVSATAAYVFTDDMDETTDLSTYWRWTNGGNWRLDINDKFNVDDTFAFTDNDAIGTVLYRVDIDSEGDPEDYQVTATISSGDNDSLGIVFYYQDDDNYYRLTINNDKDEDASKSNLVDYGHSVFLTRRADGVDTLLAITPWSGTHHWGCDNDTIGCEVSPYQTVELRVQVITRNDSKDKYILAQYYNCEIGGFVNSEIDACVNSEIGGFVNLFNGIIKDTNMRVNGGLAGVFARRMGHPAGYPPEKGGGRLHHMEVKSITSVNDIVKVKSEFNPDASFQASDLYLLDYRDSDGNGSEDVEMKLDQYAAAGEGYPMYWFLDDEEGTLTPYGLHANGVAVPITVPVGESRVSLYSNPEGAGTPVASREVWVSSQSAFTLAVLPDLQPDPDDELFRPYQIEAIMKEISKRVWDSAGQFSEDDIKISIQVGDMAVRGTEGQLERTAEYFSHLPYDMPLITAIGNHDYLGCQDDFGTSVPLLDRWSQDPDIHIFPVVTAGSRIKAGYGVETPNEIDNMYFLFDEEDLGGAGSGKWMVLSLQPNAMTKDLFWAEKIMKKYSSYNVILVSHNFLHEDGSIHDKPITWDFLIPPISPCFFQPFWITTEFAGANSPVEVWDFIKNNRQIKIILDGHTTVEGGLFTNTITRPDSDDVLVLAITTDLSYTHPYAGAGGQFRLLEIDPEQSKVRGRLVYARTHKHIGEDYDDFALAGQAINAAHSDAYFTKDMDLSGAECSGYLLSEDFNGGDRDVNEGLPGDWTVHDDATDASFWHVDMTNELGSLQWKGLLGTIESPINETDLTRRMAKYGRVQQTKTTFRCDDFHKGTYLYFNNSSAKEWSDYTFELDLSPGDDDGIGVMFYYTNDENYYRFYMSGSNNCNKGFGYYALERVASDQEPEVLASGTKAFTKHKPYKLVVDLSESGKIIIDVYDDIYDTDTVFEGNFLHIDAIDRTPLNKGTVGLYSFAMENTIFDFVFLNQAGAIFDNVLVTTDDLAPPEITCPADITANNDPGLCDALVNYEEPVGADSCPGASTNHTAGLGAGSVFPVGASTETYTVTDTVGLTAACSFTVTVKDTEAPAVTCPESIEVEPTSPAGTTVTYTTPVSSDNCYIAMFAQTDGLGSGSTFPIGTTSETYKAADGASNSASCTITVKVLSPEEVAEKLMEKIEALVAAGSLNVSQGQGLIDKLTKIIVKLESVPPLKPACKQLDAFINQVNGFVNDGVLTAAEGSGLIDSAINAAKGAGCGS